MFSLISSCNKDAFNDLNDDISRLQDSIAVINRDYTSLLDSLVRIQSTILDNGTTDLKAFKMEQIKYLFESISRQPEAAESLVKGTEILYTNYQELLPLSDKAIMERGRARGIAFGGLLEALARQPEAEALLDAAAEKFLGAYDPEIISDELLEHTKVYAVKSLVESLARYPEIAPRLSYISFKYLNYSFVDDE